MKLLYYISLALNLSLLLSVGILQIKIFNNLLYIVINARCGTLSREVNQEISKMKGWNKHFPLHVLKNGKETLNLVSLALDVVLIFRLFDGLIYCCVSICWECLGSRNHLNFLKPFSFRHNKNSKGKTFLNCTNYAVYFVIKENDMIIVQVAFSLCLSVKVCVYVYVWKGGKFTGHKINGIITVRCERKRK